ncbi:MAG: HlyD family efflux transporter periplasmic adaptor subunit [Proteiniphilum sp.]|nr:HlyD family efflux transporter periplasmic adaptor subunit [Proteiniphilum sp.]
MIRTQMNQQIGWLSAILLLTACGNRNEKNSIPAAEPLTVTQVVGIGKVIPQGGVVELAAPASGIVEERFFVAGDKVAAGDLILVLEKKDETLSLQESDAGIATQQLQVESARLALEQERIALDDLRRRHLDAVELLTVGAVTGEEVRRLQNDLDQGTEQLKKVENDYRLQQSRLREMQTARAARENNLSQRSFRAPSGGTLLTLTPRAGEAVTMHQPYGRIAPERPLMVTAEIDELFADRLAVGQRCTIHLPGDSNVAATGSVTRLSPDLKRKSLFSDSGSDLEDRRIREIEVSLDEVPRTLFIESKVECRVEIN